MNRESAISDLVRFWNTANLARSESAGKAIYVHPHDSDFFDENPQLIAPRPEDAGTLGHGFHLGLKPVPYMGNLLGDPQCADIFLLMTNPVVRLEDYRDNKNHLFIDALKDNLTGCRPACLAWDEEGTGETSWTAYYRKEVFAVTIRGERDSQLLYESLKTRLAILELVPYYSPNSRCIRENLLDTLPSVKVARRAAAYLARRANEGCAHLIIRWPNGYQRWGIRETGDNIVHSPARRGLSKCAKEKLLEWLRKDKRRTLGLNLIR